MEDSKVSLDKHIEMLGDCIEILHESIAKSARLPTAYEMLDDISRACTRLCDLVERQKSLVQYR